MSRGFLSDDAPRKSDLIDLDMVVHAETPKAWLLSDDGDRKHAVWIPKSQAEFEHRERGNMPTGTLTCPEWLAKEKGLI